MSEIDPKFVIRLSDTPLMVVCSWMGSPAVRIRSGIWVPVPELAHNIRNSKNPESAIKWYATFQSQYGHWVKDPDNHPEPMETL